MVEYDGLRRRNFKVNNLDVSDSFSGGTINVENIIATGSMNVVGNIYSENNILDGDLVLGSSVVTALSNNQGVVLNNVPAEVIISGGMWVVGSAISGTTPSVVAKPVPSSADIPLGICLSNAASGAETLILVKGTYKGAVAEATVAANIPVCVGSGGAANTVLPATVAGRARAVALMGAGSGGETELYLW